MYHVYVKAKKINIEHKEIRKKIVSPLYTHLLEQYLKIHDLSNVVVVVVVTAVVVGCAGGVTLNVKINSLVEEPNIY